MRILTLVVVWLFAIQFAFTQPNLSRVVKDLQILSADSMEGRGLSTLGSIKAQKYIQQRFVEVGLMAFDGGYARPFTLKDSEKKGTNLVGFIRGQSDSAIVITAHYDHLGIKEGKVYNGADDNASGVAGLLAIASFFQNQSPRHTLIFAALDAEEVGLKGATALLQEFPADTDLIRLNVNMDMISHNDIDELYAVGTYHYPKLKPVLEMVQTKSSVKLILGHDKPKDKLEDWTASSDHYPFHKRNIPFIYFGVEDHKDYHKDTDTFENTNAEFLKKAVQTIISFIREVDISY